MSKRQERGGERAHGERERERERTKEHEREKTRTGLLEKWKRKCANTEWKLKKKPGQMKRLCEKREKKKAKKHNTYGP